MYREREEEKELLVELSLVFTYKTDIKFDCYEAEPQLLTDTAYYPKP